MKKEDKKPSNADNFFVFLSVLISLSNVDMVSSLVLYMFA